MNKLVYSFLTTGLLLFCLTLFAHATPPAKKDTRCYEMRIYYATPDKLADLQARFRNHTTKLFKKHGMENVGYWVPVDNPDNKLMYILSYPSREARETSWKAFGSDPVWQKVAKDSEANGKLVAKVESIFMNTVDYSPAIKSSSRGDRVFELRTYKTTPGNLDALNARFRDHTVTLFAKHGMTNIGYWVPTEKDQGADDTLIYILAHKNQEEAKKSFAAFGADPAWNAAKKASEEKAGGSLTVSIESVFMTATDYSPIK